jgi:hypothetical protein
MHPDDLPPKTKSEFLKHFRSPILWPIVVQQAVREGVKNASDLADIIFHMHHHDRINSPIGAGETKLIEEWKAWRKFVEPGIAGWAKPVVKAEVDYLGHLKKYDPFLAVADGRTARYVDRLRLILIRALEGEEIDDKYWVFGYRDNFGRQHGCYENFNILTVERDRKQSSVLANFRAKAADAKTTQEVGKALVTIEKAFSCSTWVVIKWARTNQGIGDASSDDYPEIGYLKEMVKLSKKSKHVYSIYRSDLQDQLFGLTAKPSGIFPGSK